MTTQNVITQPVRLAQGEKRKLGVVYHNEEEYQKWLNSKEAASQGKRIRNRLM